MTDEGEPKYFLGVGLDYDRKKGTMKLSQKTYIEAMLVKYGMQGCSPVKTPAAVDRLTPAESPLPEEEAEYMSDKPYRNLVGALMWLMMMTRGDIDFATIQLAKNVHNPNKSHWKAAKRLLRFVSGTRDHAIVYTRDEEKEPEFDPVGYVDSDWAGCKLTRRSTTGYIFMLMGGPICWWSKIQKVVALSSTEAELIALCAAAKEAGSGSCYVT